MNTKIATISMLALATLFCGGCMQRQMHITSEPTGALCWVNDREVGVTPVDVEFTFYGEYEVRLKKDGWEPLVTKAKASQPIYERPPFDLVATPLPVKNTINWHFVMEPGKEVTQPRDEFENDLLRRASELRETIK